MERELRQNAAPGTTGKLQSTSTGCAMRDAVACVVPLDLGRARADSRWRVVPGYQAVFTCCRARWVCYDVGVSLFLSLTSVLRCFGPRVTTALVDLVLSLRMVSVETLRRTAQRVIDGYNAWTEEGLVGWRSEDCKHVVLPKSLEDREKGSEESVVFSIASPSDCSRALCCGSATSVSATTSHTADTRSRVQAQFRTIKSLYRNFTLTVRTTTIDTDACRVILHVDSTAETAVGPYVNEYIISLWMTDDGEKVKRVEEFVDSRISVRQTRAVEEKAGVWRQTRGGKTKL